MFSENEEATPNTPSTPSPPLVLLDRKYYCELSKKYSYINVKINMYSWNLQGLVLFPNVIVFATICHILL